MPVEIEPNPTPAGIICLPDENILTICSYIQSDHELDHDAYVNSLCNLSLVCRRLHYLVLPLCITMKNHLDDSLSVDVTSRDSIRPLRLALFLKSIRMLYVSFEAENYLSRLKGLLHFVENTSNIAMVNLRLPPLGKWHPQGPELLSLLSAFLQTLSKKSCESLSLQQAFALDWEAPPPYFLGLLVKPSKSSVKATSFMQLALPECHDSTPSTKLAHLVISFFAVFLPPILPEIIFTINTSPITTFDLSCEYLTSEFCSALFALLELPSLRKFTIRDSSLPFRDFQEFSLRHGTIETLSIHETRSFDHGTPAFSLPMLNYLDVSCETALCLLQQRNPELLPALTSITISSEAFNELALAAVLRAINSYPKITRLGFVTHREPFVACLHEFLQTEHQPTLFNVTDISINRQWAVREESMGATGTLLGQWIFCCFPNTRIIRLTSLWDKALCIRSSISLAQTLLVHIPWMPSIRIGGSRRHHQASCWLSQDLGSSGWVCEQTGEPLL